MNNARISAWVYRPKNEVLSWNKYENVSAQLNLLLRSCVLSPELSPSNTGRRTDVALNSSSSSSHRGRTRLAIARCRMPPPTATTTRFVEHNSFFSPPWYSGGAEDPVRVHVTLCRSYSLLLCAPPSSQNHGRIPRKTTKSNWFSGT